MSEVITEKYYAQQRLRISEAQLNEAQKLAHIGSWELNIESRTVSGSIEAHRILGVPNEQSISVERILSMATEPFRPRLENAFQLARLNCEGFDVECEMKGIDEKPFWVRLIGQVETKKKIPSRIFGTIQDVSERKRWEEEILRAKDDALKAARAKSDFLANMSHEIRTPLNAVIGMASLLLDSRLDAEQRDCANTVRTASESLLQIINQILDFSKIESGSIDLEMQPFGLIECIESAVEIVAPSAAEKNLELHCWIDPTLPGIITGDVTRLRQILVNLLANGVKFTQQGEVELRVRAKPPTEPAQEGETEIREFEFTVRDTGIGIPTERMDRLFKSFSQVDSSTTRQFGGTGLGLAICRRLVELMGGRIGVESIPDVGSTFTFVISCRTDPSSTLAPTTPLLNKRILVLTPPGNGRRILAANLDHWGAQCVMADSSSEALVLSRRPPRFDMAIVDSAELEGSPLMNHPGALNLPIVLLAPLGTKPGVTAQFFCTATISKPIKPRILLAALQRALQPGASAKAILPKPATIGDSGTSSPAKTAQQRLLLAEDNIVNQRVAISMLRRIGWEATLATNGVEAVTAAERENFKIVLMDMQMPEMDGLEATQMIRAKLPVERQPAIIALTANALPGDRERCITAGMDDYLSKPIHPDELRVKLEYWSTHKRQPSANEGNEAKAGQGTPEGT